VGAGRRGPDAPPVEFWDPFVARSWQQRPTVFRHPLASTDEVFRGVLQARTIFQPGDRASPIRFYVDHGLFRSDLPRYLPGPEDGSLARYAERVTRTLKGRRFALVINRFQMAEPALWFRLRPFLSGLYERVGIPGSLVDAALFLGTHERTPFGLHKDDSSAFAFVIEGRKTMRTWPDEFMRNQPEAWESLDYDRFLPHAVTLEGKPGDVLYWPSSHWHVAESDGRLSVSVHLLVGTEPAPQADVPDVVQRLVGARLRSTRGPGVFPLRPRRLGQAVKAASAVARAAGRVLATTSRDAELAAAIRVAWLCRLTSFGFEYVPEPAPPQPLAESAWVVADACHPILSVATRRQIVCAANGHAFAATAHPGVRALIERLNRGEACRVGDLLAAHGREVRPVLDKLLSLRAIVVTTKP
jgi:50S ribosomal protein L16 3-hydroxylase